MKILIQAIVVTLAIGSASAASAGHVPSHRHAGVGDYNALSPHVRNSDRTNVGPGVPDSAEDSHATATGGPVGGLGS